MPSSGTSAGSGGLTRRWELKGQEGTESQLGPQLGCQEEAGAGVPLGAARRSCLPRTRARLARALCGAEGQLRPRDELTM